MEIAPPISANARRRASGVKVFSQRLTGLTVSSSGTLTR
jgi:hypothetical protein